LRRKVKNLLPKPSTATDHLDSIPSILDARSRCNVVVEESHQPSN
jgi:hypothetical protein